MSELLTVSDLSVSFANTTVLSNVNLSLQPSDFVTLLGPNGSGKTTLLRALLGHIPSSGRIHWFGKPIENWSRRELARMIGYLPQVPTYMPGDRVIDVVRIGRLPHLGMLSFETERDDAVVMDVIDALALSPVIDRPLETLSGGQRQRVFLARALAQQPRVLILDEPTTFLDLKHQVELYRLLTRIIRERGIAILMASHDLHLAAVHARRGVLFKDGAVIVQGDIKDVMTSEHLSDAFGLSITRHDDGNGATFSTDFE